MQLYTTPTSLFLFCLLFACQLFAQQSDDLYEDTGGLIVEENETDKFPVDTATYVNEKGDYHDVPQSYSLKRFSPIAKIQQGMTCVGWAIAYGAYTIMEAIKYNYIDKKWISEQTALSPMYLFNKGNGDVKNGMTLSKGIEVLIKYGVCLNKTYSPNPLTIPPDSRANNEAELYRLSNHYKDVRHIFTWWNWRNTKIRLTEIYLSKKPSCDCWI